MSNEEAEDSPFHTLQPVPLEPTPLDPPREDDIASDIVSEPSTSISDEEQSTSDEDEEEEEELEQRDFDMNTEVGSIASLIAVNQTYLDLIERLTKKVEHLLENNREEQKKIKQYLNNKKNNGRQLDPIFRAIFQPPYFKDIHGMIPQSNQESREIIARCPINIHMKEEKTWTADELKLLRKAVVAQLIEAATQEVIHRRNHFRDKIKNYSSATDTIEQLAHWKASLEAANRRLAYLSSRNEDYVLKSATYDSIDWARIATRDFKCSRSIQQLKAKWLYEQQPAWNKSAWTEAEDEAILAAGKSPWQNWDLVAAKLDTNRSAYMCFERYHVLSKKISLKRPWTTREDEKLLSLVERFTVEGNTSWKRVAAHMPDRNRTQCEIRYVRSLDPNLIHGRWTEDEDMLLIASVNKYGPHDWPRIAKLIPGRTDVQCRARWVDVLDYKRSSAPWSSDEDEAILVGIQVFGRSSFSNIAKLLPGRNSTAVKSRVRMLFRWKILATIKEDPPSSMSSSVQVTEVARARREAVMERFNQVMEMSRKLANNQHGYALARRLGYGNFVVENSQQTSDYSVVKKHISQEFGKWFISKSGRWVRLGKNPNEFGEEELNSVMASLPEDKRRVLEEFLAERAQRQLTIQLLGALTQEQETAQSERIANLMDTVIVVEDKDIDAYNKSIRRGGDNRLLLKLPKQSKDKTGLPNKRRPTRKSAALNFSALIHDLAPRRYSIADRLTDEITYRLARIPMEDRRNFIIGALCDNIAYQMEHEVSLAANTIPLGIVNLRIYNFLRNEFAKHELSEARFNSFHGAESLPPDEFTGSHPPPSPTPNSSNSIGEPRSSLDRETPPIFDISRTLRSLVSPSVASCVYIHHYKETIVPLLSKTAGVLFSKLPIDVPVADEEQADHSPLDIRLSEEVTSDPAYLRLKQRMMRLFLLPMLLRRALETRDVQESRNEVRRCASNLQVLQQTQLDDSGFSVEGRTIVPAGTNAPESLRAAEECNRRAIEELSEKLSFKVHDPLRKKTVTRQEVLDATAAPPPPKRPRKAKPEKKEDDGVMTVREALEAERRGISLPFQLNPLLNLLPGSSDPPKPTVTISYTSTTSSDPIMTLITQPNYGIETPPPPAQAPLLGYRPQRRGAAPPPTVNPNTMSVREFLIQNQALIDFNFVPRRRSVKRKK